MMHSQFVFKTCRRALNGCWTRYHLTFSSCFHSAWRPYWVFGCNFASNTHRHPCDINDRFVFRKRTKTWLDTPKESQRCWFSHRSSVTHGRCKPSRSEWDCRSSGAHCHVSTLYFKQCCAIGSVIAPGLLFSTSIITTKSYLLWGIIIYCGVFCRISMLKAAWEGNFTICFRFGSVIAVLNLRLAVKGVTYRSHLLCRIRTIELFGCCCINFYYLSDISRWKMLKIRFKAKRHTSQMLSFVLLCCVFANVATLQETFRWGRSPTLLHRLCNLPFRFFSDEW